MHTPSAYTSCAQAFIQRYANMSSSMLAFKKSCRFNITFNEHEPISTFYSTHANTLYPGQVKTVKNIKFVS